MLDHLPLEEKWNVYTHGFGAVISLLGIIWIFSHPVALDFWASVGVFIYGFSMVFLFSASSIYHGVKLKYQAFWQKIDHIGIFLLIAGSYTPVTLTILKESSGYYLLAGVWAIAIVGTVYKLFFIGRFKNLSLLLYLAMGWLVIFDIENVMTLFPAQAFFYLALGGGFYTVGTIFYRWERLYFHHVIWHVFVLGGAAAHFMMVKELVL
ncbi:MAG: hemolysin III family protein [Flavobacteriaceae bacterium]|nr:hemolysin III family protein [Flavobacteriaceae bacterium]